MPRLTSHIANPANDRLSVHVLDEPGCGGACHEYMILWVDDEGSSKSCRIGFQDGPIREVGVNGVTHEALLAILEHRLLGFQSGAYSCEENAKALGHIQAALEILKARTRERTARGVEGTHGR